ncbi:hypothetical protein I35_6222 [Burkholderia cenocepacia H111]|nr:hypothetical protein I35_6222 [Burkholderia cenocepacia H111]
MLRIGALDARGRWNAALRSARATRDDHVWNDRGACAARASAGVWPIDSNGQFH